MDFIDIIGTLLEFSQKGKEFSDEVSQINNTLISLEITVKGLSEDDLPSHVKQNLEADLQEAKGLLQQIANRPDNLWQNFKLMLPGSDLHKIREKNDSFVHHIQLINLHLNANKANFKRKPLCQLQNKVRKQIRTNRDTASVLQTSANSKVSTTYGSDSEDETESVKTALNRFNSLKIGRCFQKINTPKKSNSVDNAFDLPTLPNTQCSPISNVLLKPTQIDFVDERVNQTPTKEQTSFKLRVIYNKRLGPKILKDKHFEPEIQKFWKDGDDETSEYSIKRENYLYLPGDYVTRMSRDHAIVTATRKRPVTSSQLIPKGMTTQEIRFASTLPDDISEAIKVYGSTLPDTQSQYDNPNDEEETKCSMHDEGSQQVVKTKIILRDLSLNGTYYLKGQEVLPSNKKGYEVKGKFKQLHKDEETELQHGDIIGMIMQKPECEEVIFGFQLLEY